MLVLDEFLHLTKVNLEMIWYAGIDEIAPNILAYYEKKSEWQRRWARS